MRKYNIEIQHNGAEKKPTTEEIQHETIFHLATKKDGLGKTRDPSIKKKGVK